MKHRNLRGAALHAPSNEVVENNTGVDIPAFKAVTFNGIGTSFGYPSIALNNAPTTVLRGVTQSVIPAAAGLNSGYITALGFLNGTATQPIDTHLWPIGTKLFSDASGNLGSTPSGFPAGIVLKQDAVLGVLYVDTVGFTKSDIELLEFPDSLSLELAWDINYPSFYTEPTYNLDGTIATLDIWDSASKTVHVFNKTYTWMSGQLTKVVITRIPDSQTLEKDFVYNLDGSLKNVTRIYTP